MLSKLNYEEIPCGRQTRARAYTGLTRKTIKECVDVGEDTSRNPLKKFQRPPVTKYKGRPSKPDSFVKDVVVTVIVVVW